MIRKFNPDQRQVAADYKKSLGLEHLTGDELEAAIDQLGLPLGDRDGVIEDTPKPQTPSKKQLGKVASIRIKPPKDKQRRLQEDKHRAEEADPWGR